MLPWLLVFSALSVQALGQMYPTSNCSPCQKAPSDIHGPRTDIFTMVSRKEWGAGAAGCRSPLTTPVDVLVTHHVPGLECHDQAACSQRLRELQSYQVHNYSGCDVAYNFLVGDDGRVYEGVGWDVHGLHTQGYNNVSLGIAFFGTKEGQSPSPAALTAMKGLISYAVLQGRLSPSYTQPLLVRGENCLAPPQKAGLRKACPSIIRQGAWGARPSHCPRMQLPAKYAIILHTGGRTCGAAAECRLLVADLQALFMDKYEACDVGYNFLVGQDGGVYEGVGWDVQGSSIPGYNDIALGIVFMGTFSGDPPNAAALEAAQDLIQCAVAKGYLAPNYLLLGHSDVANTLSPGQALYSIIRTWPHFKH